MSSTHGYSIKAQRCYGKQDWGAKSRTNALGTLMGCTSGPIELLTGSVEVLMCWVEAMFLINIPDKRGSVMNNSAFRQGKAMQKIIKEAGHTLLTSLFS
ncbi:hypothetical protein HCUR_01357 [Holospora curviuscula]|uniref:Uncharacterized protein n=1 Tax=Holospora curviuscula TaxID=1082868 RepID=A0A2S5R7E7_9PROT|nr:hypothetical protein [Holospora curviuscula]PPE03217.1 hypothetical protein HCUR_01357 [Holospora curviuscula]